MVNWNSAQDIQNLLFLLGSSGPANSSKVHTAHWFHAQALGPERENVPQFHAVVAQRLPFHIPTEMASAVTRKQEKQGSVEELKVRPRHTRKLKFSEGHKGRKYFLGAQH